MRKEGIPELIIRSVMRLYERTMTSVRVDSELSQELEVKERMHQGSVLSPFLLPFMVVVVTEIARQGALSELLYTDDLVQMSEKIERLRDKFLN